MRHKSARPEALVRFAASSVFQTFGDLSPKSAVDLFSLARCRMIQAVEFRPLLADGCLVVNEAGFTVQICDDQIEVIDLQQSPTVRSLTAKQRFTFAHEIAHTLPYDTAMAPPRVKPGALKAIEAAGERSRTESLESFCQIAAGFILVPRKSLRQTDILGDQGQINSIEHVRLLARRFEVSPEMMIHRIADAGEDDDLSAPYFTLLLVSTVRGIEQIRACIYSPGLNGLARKPRLYTKISTWVDKTSILASCKLLDVKEGEWERRTTTGVLHIRKIRYTSNPASYFVELKHSEGTSLGAQEVAD